MLWLLRYRFNFIDACALSAGAVCITNGRFLAAFVIYGMGVALTLILLPKKKKE